MKCVQIVGQGIPVRLSDDDAFQIVERDKDGEYCPKHVWKEFYDATENRRLVARIDSKGRIVNV
jgi:hypothetical protein